MLCVLGLVKDEDIAGEHISTEVGDVIYTPLLEILYEDSQFFTKLNPNTSKNNKNKHGNGKNGGLSNRKSLDMRAKVKA